MLYSYPNILILYSCLIRSFRAPHYNFFRNALFCIAVTIFYDAKLNFILAESILGGFDSQTNGTFSAGGKENLKVD